MAIEKFVPAEIYLTADQARAKLELRLFRFEQPDTDDLLGANRDYTEQDSRHNTPLSSDTVLREVNQKTESPHGL